MKRIEFGELQIGEIAKNNLLHVCETNWASGGPKVKELEKKWSSLFGYEFMFIAIDKKTHQIGIYDCSTEFYESGQDKVKRASEAYDLFYKTDSFDPKQYFISKTL